MITADVVLRNLHLPGEGGGPSHPTDLTVHEGRIVALGSAGTGATIATEVIDASGLCLHPGGIQLARSRLPLASSRWGVDLVRRGVTSVLVGADGRSVSPAWAAAHLPAPGRRSLPGWLSYGAFLAQVDAEPPVVNVAVFVGHATLRFEAMGNAARPAWPSERRLLRRWMEEGMADGALGLASDLRAEPGCYTPIDELEELAAIAGRAGGTWRCAPARGAGTATIAEAAARAGVALLPSTAGVDAVRLGLGRRGSLEPGAPADLVVADADGRPRHVLVNGVLAVRDGQPTGQHAGRALRLEPG